VRVTTAWVARLASLALGLAPALRAQTGLQHVTGTVRDLAANPVADAEVLVGGRRTTTGPQGIFRIDSLKPGVYPLTIRRIGYRPIHSRMPVVASEPTEAEYVLLPAPFRLPEIVVEGRRRGIYGVVADTGLRPLPGATVEVLGNGGGTAITDSLGRFAFADARNGIYLVRVTRSGFGERRIMVDLYPGDSREVTALLAPGLTGGSRFETAALEDLDRRLALGLRRSFLTRDELQRYGSMSLCDVPRVRTTAGDLPTVIVNGTMVMRGVSICSWRMDEIALLEVGAEICGDASRTLAFALGTPCSGASRMGTRRATRARQPSGRGGGYVVIWEKW